MRHAIRSSRFPSKGGQPLVINDDGKCFLEREIRTAVAKIPPTDAEDQSPKIHESLTRFWSFVDLIPRLEIDNTGHWPRRRAQRPGKLHAYRSPELFLRDGTMSFHDSVGDLPCGREARVVSTRLRTQMTQMT